MAAQAPPLLKNYLDAWFAQDIDTMTSMLSDDLVLWHNHIGTKFGKTEMLIFLHAALEVLKKVEFRNQRWTTIDHRRVVLQHDMYIETRDGRVLSDIPNAIFYTLRDGQIVGIEEYVDGPAFAPLGIA